MELRDLIVTPIVVLLVLAAAYYIRPRVTDENTSRYFFPALLVKIFGAIALGFIYQFYYDGGDTFNFHTHGSRHIWNAFVDDPMKGLKLMFGSKDNLVGIYDYTSRIIFFHDHNSFFIIRIASIFDILTFSSYSATGVLFSVIGFIGGWMLFKTFYELYPRVHFGLALACLFIPSVFFWGSGILKDTLVLACLGISTALVKSLFIDFRFSLLKIFLLALCMYAIFGIKKFVLQAYLPAILLWITGAHFGKIRSNAFKALIVPFIFGVVAYVGFYSIVKVGEGDVRYSVDNLAITAKRTAYDIRYWTGRDAGSGYSLGELDGTFQSLLRLAPAAINVTLFRPYLWEVKNPLMVLSALESLLFLLISVFIVTKGNLLLFRRLSDFNILFCVFFSLSFAFAVGVSTFNFGTLSRYKISMLPFFGIALAILYDYVKSAKKTDSFDRIE